MNASQDSNVLPPPTPTARRNALLGVLRDALTLCASGQALDPDVNWWGIALAGQAASWYLPDDLDAWHAYDTVTRALEWYERQADRDPAAAVLALVEDDGQRAIYALAAMENLLSCPACLGDNNAALDYATACRAATEDTMLIGARHKLVMA